MEDKKWMREALGEASKAASLSEVPIGAVIVKDHVAVSRGYNLRETGDDPTLHAEMIAIREAARALGGWRLNGCTLYVTIEPCPMCAGAILMARIDRVVYGAADPKAGCAGTLCDLLSDTRFNHTAQVVSGVCEAECRAVIRDFFKSRRG